MSRFRIGSFNILNGVHAVKWSTTEGYEIVNGEKRSNWESGRRERVYECIQKADCDVICLQEVCRKTWLELQTHGFTVSKLAISANLQGKQEPDYCDGPCILYKPDRVELVEDEVKQTTLDHRYYSSILVRHRQNGQLFRILSVHLKGYNPFESNTVARRQSKVMGYVELMEIVASTLALPQRGETVIVAGDMNEDENESTHYQDGLSRHEFLKRHGFIHDSADQKSLPPTEFRTGRTIDWIYGRANGLILQGIDHKGQDPNASDHALIVSECHLDLIS